MLRFYFLDIDNENISRQLYININDGLNLNKIIFISVYCNFICKIFKLEFNQMFFIG